MFRRIINIMLIGLICSINTNAQQTTTKNIYVVEESNKPITLYHGEVLKVEHLSGSINECPYDKKKKKGGFFGIGRRTVKIRINNFKSPMPGRKHALRSPAYKVGETLKDIIAQGDAIAVSGGVTEPMYVTFFIPGQCSNRSNGTYTLKYRIESKTRLRNIKQYIKNNSLKKDALISEIENPKSNLFNSRLRDYNSRELSATIFNAVQEMGIFSDTHRFAIYKAVFYHIDTSYLPMLAEMSVLAAKLNEFNIQDELNTAIGESFKKFNPPTYYHRLKYGNVLKAQGDSEYNKNLGTERKNLEAASFLYSDAAYAFLSIGEKSKAVESMLKLSRTLQRFKEENTLKNIEKAISVFKDTLTGQKWYYISPTKNRSLYLEIDTQLAVRADNTIQLKTSQGNIKLRDSALTIDEKKILLNLEEFIMMPDVTLTIEDSDAYDEIIINAKQAAFAKNTKIVAVTNPRIGKAATGVHRDGDVHRGQGETTWPDINGTNGTKGRKAKDITLNIGLAQIDGLMIESNGGRGQDGGDGGNGCKGSIVGNTSPPSYIGAGEGGIPGLGGYGGDPGKVIFRYYPLNSKIELNSTNLVVKANYGAAGKAGVYGLKYSKLGYQDEKSMSTRMSLTSTLQEQQDARINKQQEKLPPKEVKLSKTNFEIKFNTKLFSSRQEWLNQFKNL